MKNARFWIGIGVWTVASTLMVDRADAQPSRFEIGLDGAISFSFVSTPEGQDSDPIQTWALPLRRVRAGFHVSRPLQIQMSTGFEVADFGEVSTVRFAVGLAGLVHFLNLGSRKGPFVSLGGGLDLLSEAGSDLQWIIAGGFGYKIPLGSRFALRPAMEMSRAFESDGRFAETTVSAVIGGSVFID